MKTELNANFVYCEIEDDVIMVGFADDEFETNKHIMFQKLLEYDEQDKKLGHDKVHITFIDQLHSAYGGILKVILKKEIVDIYVDKNTAEELETEEKIRVFLPKKEIDLNKLKYHFLLMFKEEKELLVIDI